MNCRICSRELGRGDDPLSLNCGGDCWGCIGEIEAQMGSEAALARVRAEAAEGLRPNWKDTALQQSAATRSHLSNPVSKEICVIYSRDRKRRIAIFRRTAESFGSFEQYYFRSDEAGIDGWASLPPDSSFYEDLETAKRESILGVRWPLDSEGFVSAEKLP